MKIDKKLAPLIDLLNQKLSKLQDCTLNNAEVIILQGIWKNQTYSQIAKEHSYSSEYLSNVVAPQLCHRLSELIGKRLTKKNCQGLIESYASQEILTKTTLPQKNSARAVERFNLNTSLRYPNGSVPLDSNFYIEHFDAQEKLYEEVCKPGALIRIKAPKEMGKTSLVMRMLDYANFRGYCAVSLNLEQIEQAILSDLDRFLRWLCANISYKLNLEPRLDEYWDEDVGSKVSCTLYFRNYILQQIDSPLVLALDDLHYIFEYSHVAQDFLPLLRSWYEEAKRTSIWKKLRLVVSHSTEIYIPLEMNQSPFNVGLPIKLSGFDLDRVLELAQRYKLHWIDDLKARQLMNIIGGHPALISIAFYYLSCESMNFEQLLESIFDSTGIYASHLQSHWVSMEQQPELLAVLIKVMNVNQPVKLEPIMAHKLSSLGLVKLLDNEAIPSCELYKHYFINVSRGWSRQKV